MSLMQVEIIAIGNEVLEGFTINANAAFLSQELMKSGFHIARHMVLPDNPNALAEGLREALVRSPIVITTGGLGPTLDDLSKEAAAKLFDSKLHFDESIASELEKRYGRRIPSVDNQATVPDKAKVIPNRVGTAPGFIFQSGYSTLIMLPGVPSEMRHMLFEEVLPWLAQDNAFQKKRRQFFKPIHFLETIESKVDPMLRRIEAENPSVKAGIYPNLGLLTVQLMCESDSENEAMELLKKPYELLVETFRERVFESSTGKIEEAVHSLFVQNKWTLGAAESCTGGSLSSRLTLIPGASSYFQGSIVAYSNEIKKSFLSVSDTTLKTFGAVSQETAVEMAEGFLKRANVDFAISVTGIAGPTGGSPEKPVGTVWCAIAGKTKQTVSFKLKGIGNREMIIARSVNGALANLYLYASGRPLQI